MCLWETRSCETKTVAASVSFGCSFLFKNVLTSWVWIYLPHVVERSACSGEDNPNGNSAGTHKDHQRLDESADPCHADKPLEQKQHVDFEAPDQPDVCVPSDNKPFGAFLPGGSLRRAHRYSLLVCEIGCITGTAHNIGCHGHGGIASLRSE